MTYAECRGSVDASGRLGGMWHMEKHTPEGGELACGTMRNVLLSDTIVVNGGVNVRGINGASRRNRLEAVLETRQKDMLHSIQFTRWECRSFVFSW